MIRVDVEASETWKPCYDGLYEASNQGRVRRLAAYPPRGIECVDRSPYRSVLKPCKRKDGYLVVGVCNGQKRKIRGLHQLVAEAFYGLRPEGLVTNHKNGIKTDNRPQNLEYVTQADNNRHAIAIGLFDPHANGRPGASNGRARLSEADVIAIRQLRADGHTNKQVAQRFGVCSSTVDAIKRRVNWRHLS